MGTESIKNEEEYNNALDRANKLMDAKPYTDEYNELELLTNLIAAYEEIHYKIEDPTL